VGRKICTGEEVGGTYKTIGRQSDARFVPTKRLAAPMKPLAVMRKPLGGDAEAVGSWVKGFGGRC